jgi:hypothetical protein
MRCRFLATPGSIMTSGQIFLAEIVDLVELNGIEPMTS